MFKLNRFIGFIAIALVTFSINTAIAKPYKGGEIYSKQTYKYGRYEMRMQTAKGSGVDRKSVV